MTTTANKGVLSVAHKKTEIRGVRRAMVVAIALGAAAGLSTAAPVQAAPQQATVSVWTSDGWGGGTVTSQPTGINCHQPAWQPYSEEPQQPPTGTCSASFPVGTTVTFTATPDPGSYFNYADPNPKTVYPGYNPVYVVFCPENDYCMAPL
ncbi:hypothetical protein [Streptomyces sp. ISL-96]|uniref:hypothetical protein n=1 Tax=Streptomyces sp. ISL-96 TaxID=2819191 RepID=UPI0020360BD5|nr:hypothetical protein [Streptomyces sp. ISL-96]